MSNYLSRRHMLQSLSCGFGYMALAGLASTAAAKESAANDKSEGFQNPLAPKATHHQARAKRVIFLCMRGGPSHVDTFDYKPQLAADDGKQAAGQGKRKWLTSPWKFSQYGESGLPISELFPHVANHADDLCLLNGMHTEVPNHPQAYVKLHTGSFRFVRPSVGSWLLYGLGTENSDLPGFLAINPETRVGGAQNYGSAFLPAVYQGAAVGSLGRPLKGVEINNIANSRLPRKVQREQIDLVQAMNRDLLEQQQVNTELEGVIESYELAFRMQSAAPKLLDFSEETEATLAAYGIDEKGTDDFGRQCLLARRSAEAGVRYIELTHANWDQHGSLRKKLSDNCQNIDKPIGALLADLKQRGMLDDTLIVWGGEFGRTPHVKNNDGRDHNANGFTMWMAGGGIKGGQRYGSTDEHGTAAVEGKMNFHDLHATMLHLAGLDHTQLTYRYAGRDFRLTDVYGRVVEEIMA